MAGQHNPRIPNLQQEEDISYFENKSGMVEDLKFLASIPELCDATFFVGANQEPVCGVKAIMAARSRIFYQLFYQDPPMAPVVESPKESMLRSIIKRKSDASTGGASAASSGDSSRDTVIEYYGHTMVKITEFDPDVFRQIVEYVHTGNIILQPRTLLGVMSASDKYGLDELRKSCTVFVQNSINVDTVCALLQSADRYVHYKSTKSFLKQVLDFVDVHGNEVLNLGSFALLPLHVVRLILARAELDAEEFTKFQASLMWTMKYSDLNKNVDWKKTFRENFLNMIKYHKIPATVLMKDVDPLKVVPNEIIMAALAYQADPTCVKPHELITGIKISDSDSNISDFEDEDDDDFEADTSSLDTFHGNLLEAFPDDDDAIN